MLLQKCTQEVGIPSCNNYEKSRDIKYLNIGREDDVTASFGKWLHRGITVCIKECCKKVVRAKGIL